MRSAISTEALEPLIVLLKSRDDQVQKAASLAISNFALHGPGQFLNVPLPLLLLLLFVLFLFLSCSSTLFLSSLSFLPFFPFNFFLLQICINIYTQSGMGAYNRIPFVQHREYVINATELSVFG